MIQSQQPFAAALTSRSFGRSFSNGLLAISKTPTTQAACVRSFSILRSSPDISASAPSNSKRPFSFTSASHREFFPLTSTDKVRETRPAWPHPIYSEQQMSEVTIAHREAKNWSDYFALGAARVLRFGLDRVTGYKHDKASPKSAHRPAFAMNERKYLIRNVFLESVAGVPGMVAGMLRHLSSMRKMKRDNGWIETLLEESFNERMHLLIFLRMYEPGWFMRLMVLGAQGVFFNGFFIAYLLSPRTAHRFVGYIEEEAVITYTREIQDIESGKLAEWAKMEAPDIAVKYYDMPEGHRSIRDMLLYIRADESKHREVNHTLGNLNQKEDPNPYVSEYKDLKAPHPTKDIEHQKPTGWERSEII